MRPPVSAVAGECAQRSKNHFLSPCCVLRTSGGEGNSFFIWYTFATRNLRRQCEHI